MKQSSRPDRYLKIISENKIITGIRCGLLYIAPMVMVGSFILMILNLPIESFQTLMNSIFGEHWRNIGLAMYKGTFEIMSLAAVMSIAYAYGQLFPSVEKGEVNSFSVILCAICSFFTFNRISDVLIEVNSANSNGLFTAIVIAIVSTRLYLFFFHLIPNRHNVYSYDADSLLLYSLRSILPLFLTLAGFAVARILLNLLGIDTLFSVIGEMINGAFATEQGGMMTTVFFILTTQVLWFFGIHGGNVLAGLSENLFVSASATNIALAVSGEIPTEIITKEFLDAFVFMGGAGCTLGFIIALLISRRTNNVNRVAKYSLLPGIFNINETLTYGIPIMFNPYYLIPFVLSPIVISMVSYFAFWSGLVPLTMSRVQWTTPIFLSGYVSTGSISGAVLQLINLTISVGIYMPFIKLYEKHIKLSNEELFAKFSAKLIRTEASPTPDKVLGRNDGIGSIARSLVSDLERKISKNEESDLKLYYQPKVTKEGKVFGAEALLRWFHPNFGYISPLIVIALCDEAGLGNELGRWVTSRACNKLGEWNRDGHKDIKLAINIMPQQIRDDGSLLEFIQQTLHETGVVPACLELELTEHEALDQSDLTGNRLKQLRELGLSISIDDFGMGSSSLLYIKNSYVNVVKIDMSLVSSITTNYESQEIVRSIFALCEQVNVDVVAEGVETVEQLEQLEQLGCRVYQGFLFSPARPANEFIQYLNQNGRAN